MRIRVIVRAWCRWAGQRHGGQVALLLAGTAFPMLVCLLAVPAGIQAHNDERKAAVTAIRRQIHEPISDSITAVWLAREESARRVRLKLEEERRQALQKSASDFTKRVMQNSELISALIAPMPSSDSAKQDAMLRMDASTLAWTLVEQVDVTDVTVPKRPLIIAAIAALLGLCLIVFQGSLVWYWLEARRVRGAHGGVP